MRYVVPVLEKNTQRTFKQAQERQHRPVTAQHAFILMKRHIIPSAEESEGQGSLQEQEAWGLGTLPVCRQRGVETPQQ